MLFLYFFITPKIFASSSPTITDYWNGKAQFVFTQKLTGDDPQWEGGSDAGVHFEIEGNTWYLFTRQVHWGNKPIYCPSETLSMEVRKSEDGGKTWSIPIEIIHNTPGTPWECDGTDGDAYYNQTENRWHYIFQCLDRNGKWSGCHAIRDGANPYGVFTPTADNPVITPREIWSKICNNPTADCYILSNAPTWGIFDEGTFDIFDYQNGYYYVDFHGTDGIRGYRGLAKTKDFQLWETVVNDDILDLKDALPFWTKWDENGPIGFGAGRIIKDQGYYYLISEAADKNLACTKGQIWVWGMFRSQNLASTTWEQFPQGNPFFTVNNFPDPDPNPLPCNPEYAGFFTSNGTLYFHASRPSYTPSLSGIYIYKLTSNSMTGDLNRDGKVDIFDYNILIGNFGKTGAPGFIPADIDKNGKVDIFDYNELVGNYGK